MPTHRASATSHAPGVPRRRVSLIVLGDVGRSPRMQYHALALATSFAEVDVIGYAGSTVHGAIRNHPHIHWHVFRPLAPHWRQRLPQSLFMVYGLLRAANECLQLLWLLLFVVPRPQIILVQNPPAVPTLLIALAVARLRRARLIIDWHNLAYTMLALRFGEHHPLIGPARWYEGAVGRHADAHLCVSRAMQAELQERWNLRDVTVLYDQPAQFFVPTPLSRQRELFSRLHAWLDVAGLDTGPAADTAGNAAHACRGVRRPAIIVSPTSWTADEDIALLVDAACRCDQIIRRREAALGPDAFPHLVILMTGKGPLRQHYESVIALLELRKVHLQTLWLEAEEYAVLLGAADLGVCLHRSSSGVDLPMKLADMSGAGLPACVLDYGPCLAERVRHGENGLLFSTGEQLAEQLYELFKAFPKQTPRLDRLRRAGRARQRQGWMDAWEKHALPVFVSL